MKQIEIIRRREESDSQAIGSWSRRMELQCVEKEKKRRSRIVKKAGSNQKANFGNSHVEMPKIHKSGVKRILPEK